MLQSLPEMPNDSLVAKNLEALKKQTAVRKNPTERTGYMVPADSTKNKLPQNMTTDEVTKWFKETVEKHRNNKTNNESKPDTINYPNGHYEKINGEWQKVTQKRFIPADTPEKKHDLYEKWLNSIK